MTIKLDNEGEEYYSPDGDVAEPIVIPDSQYAEDDIDGLFKEGETQSASLDTEVGIDYLSDKIYVDFESSIRELYNNEVTASHIAGRMGDNAHPLIHITIDPIKRYFEIPGFDSLGITPSILKNKLMVFGRSGNINNGGEIGQFGMGFASYKKMFDIIHLTTWARGVGKDGKEFKPYTMLCEKGKTFTRTKSEDIDHYGTKIHGTYREGISADKIIAKVKDCAKHQDVKTWIHLVNDTDQETSGDYECFQYKDGYHYLMQQKADRVEQQDRRRAKQVFFRPIKIIRDDFEFFAFLGAYESRWGGIDSESIDSDKCQVRLVGTPIIAELPYDIVNAVSGYFLNIKDERKYPPTADRDRLSTGSIDSIAEEIKSELYELYKEYILEDVADYKTRDNKYVFDSSLWRCVNYVLQNDTTDNILNTLHRSYTTHPDKHLYTIQQMMEHQTLQEKKGLTHTIVALKGLRGDVMRRLDTVFNKDGQSRRYFRLPSRDNYERSEERMTILRQLGVVFGEEYIREHKVKAQRVSREARARGEVANVSVRLYTRTGRSEQTGANTWGWGNYYELFSSHLLSEVNDHAHPFMVRVDTPDWTSAVRHTYRTDFLLLHNRKGFIDKIKTKAEVFKELEDTLFEVNEEQMTLKELMTLQRKDKRTTNKRSVIYCRYDNSEQETRDDMTGGKFTLAELGLNPDEHYLISPVNKPKSVKRLMDLLLWYNHDHLNANGEHILKYVGEDNHKISELMYAELLIEEADKIEGDKLEKVSALLRMKRICKEAKQMEIYDLCKQAIILHDDNNTNDVMGLVEEALEKNK